MDITYIDRKTGKRSKEKVYGGKLLSLLYGDGVFNAFFSKILLPFLARISFFSSLAGYWQKRPQSAAKIKPFIAAYGIDETEFETLEFGSFNDFFIRKLKKEKRPIDPDSDTAVLPADGRYLAFPRFDRFFIKGQEFCLDEFLQDAALSRRYSEGAMLIARLCPTDYHRFHFPCDGLASRPRLINGFLYSVNPIALRKNVRILSENKRMVTEIETSHFGSLLYIEIGATCVGSIHQTFPSGCPVQKGDEKGYFEFGGSCLVLLFEKNKIAFDADLVSNTRNGLETLCRFGDSLGKKI